MSCKMLTAVPGTVIRTADRVSQRYQSIPGPFRRRSLVFSLVGTRLHERDRRCAPTQFIYLVRLTTVKSNQLHKLDSNAVTKFIYLRSIIKTSLDEDTSVFLGGAPGFRE